MLKNRKGRGCLEMRSRALWQYGTDQISLYFEKIIKLTLKRGSRNTRGLDILLDRVYDISKYILFIVLMLFTCRRTDNKRLS